MGNELSSCCGRTGGHDFDPAGAAAQPPRQDRQGNRRPGGGLRMSINAATKAEASSNGGIQIRPTAGKTPAPAVERYTALYPHNGGFTEALDFAAGETIIVTGKQDRFTLLGYREERPGSVGQFPATYVEKSMVVVYPFKQPNMQGRPTLSNLGQHRHRNKRLQVTFDATVTDPERLEAFAKQEYDRCGPFDPVKSSAEWEVEEAEEMKRQLFVRWETFETKLPRGTKCGERAAYEKANAAQIQAEANSAQTDAAEKERRRAIFLAKRAAKKQADLTAQQAQFYGGGDEEC